MNEHLKPELPSITHQIAIIEKATAEIKRINEREKVNIDRKVSSETLSQEEELKKVIYLQAYFDQGQRVFFDQNYDDDLTSVASISFLINRSMFELSNAIVKNDDILKKGMLNNLFVIAERFKDLRGFNLALNGLQEKFSITNSQTNLPETTEWHKDNRLFPVILDKLNKKGFKISPFYFAIDENNNLYRAN